MLCHPLSTCFTTFLEEGIIKDGTVDNVNHACLFHVPRKLYQRNNSYGIQFIRGIENRCLLAFLHNFFHLFHQEKVRLMTILGSGILVGTALSVIIPEGVNAIYTTSHSHEHLPPGSTEREVHSKHREENAHSSIGITLVLGFVFMFVVDQIINKRSSVTYTPVDTVDDSDSVSVTVTTTPAQNKRKSSKVTATIGLIVHSAADGVALGAAASTSHTDVEMIVFLAIMLHKAPAAFGLVTFLLHEGLDKSRIKKHLLAFSLSAPLGAFVTYLCLGGGTFQDSSFSDYNATGIAMLFSAGTFLFVATVHVLPEVTQEKDLKLLEVVLLITGSFLPSLLSVHHHH